MFTTVQLIEMIGRNPTLRGMSKENIENYLLHQNVDPAIAEAVSAADIEKLTSLISVDSRGCYLLILPIDELESSDLNTTHKSNKLNIQ